MDKKDIALGSGRRKKDRKEDKRRRRKGIPRNMLSMPKLWVQREQLLVRRKRNREEKDEHT